MTEMTGTSRETPRADIVKAVEEVLRTENAALAIPDIHQLVPEVEPRKEIILALASLKRAGTVIVHDVHGERRYQINSNPAPAPDTSNSRFSAWSPDRESTEVRETKPVAKNAASGRSKTRTRQPWTTAEDAVIREVRADGGSYEDIRSRLPHRTIPSIRARISNLGLARKRNAKKKPTKKQGQRKNLSPKNGGTSGLERGVLLQRAYDRSQDELEQYVKSCCDLEVLSVLRRQCEIARDACERHQVGLGE